jgi:hypothetical protein
MAPTLAVPPPAATWAMRSAAFMGTSLEANAAAQPTSGAGVSAVAAARSAVRAR